MTKKEGGTLELVSRQLDPSNRMYCISVLEGRDKISDIAERIISECNGNGTGPMKICLQSDRYPLQITANYLRNEFSRRGYNTRVIENGIILGNISREGDIITKNCTIEDYL